MTPLRFWLRSLPDLLPVQLNPHGLEIEQQSNQWARSQLRSFFANSEDLEKFIAMRCAFWPILCYPSAPPDRLLNLCNWYQLWFLLDDWYSADRQAAHDVEGAKPVFKALSKALSGIHPGSEQGQLPLLLYEVWQQLTADMSQPLMRRFANAFIDMLEAWTKEISVRANDEPIDLETYLHIRYTSAAYGCILSCEYSLGIDLTDLWEHNRGKLELETLYRRGSDIFVLLNDMIAFGREYFAGDYFNAVAILFRHSGLDLQEIADTLQNRLSDAVGEFAARRDALLQGELGAHQQFRDYLIELGYLIAGCVRWMYVAPRYYENGYVWKGNLSGILTFTPERTTFEADCEDRRKP